VLARVALIASFLGAPSLATLVGGAAGFVATYAVLSSLVAASLTLAIPRLGGGRGDVSVRDSLALAGLGIALFTALGLVTRLGARPLGLSSLPTNAAILGLTVLSIEIPRRLAMSLVKGPAQRIAVGTIVGILAMRTWQYLGLLAQRAASNPFSVLGIVSYSVLLSTMQVYGGLAQAAAFSFVMGWYWSYSPIVLDKTFFGAVWPSIAAIVYVSMASYVSSAFPRLAGASREVLARVSRLWRARVIASYAVPALALGIVVSLAVLKVVPLAVVSGSMVPTIGVGDVVLVKLGSSVRVGDVIAYRWGDEVVVHRVIKVVRGGFVTKGDANPSPDPFVVKPSWVLGRVVATVPKVGLLAIAVRGGGSKPLVIATMLGAMVAAPALGLLHRRKRKPIDLNRVWGEVSGERN